jgi:chloride channel 7
MVHAGAVVAAGVSQGKSNTLGFDTAFSKFQDFRNDAEKRDFVACGAAAGVAAAFGAPIGGVLFSLEEGASFWSTKLTWRCFFCAMTTVFTVYAINTANSQFGHSDSTAMFSFGEFYSLQGEKSNYSVWELSLFMLIGSLGGIIGAVFNSFNMQLFQWRSVLLTSKLSRLTEALVVTVVMTLFAFVLPLLWTKCTPLPTDMEGWVDQEKMLVADLVAMYCPKETHYNELASLYLTDSDVSIKQLFHFREIGDDNVSTFSSFALFQFLIPYIVMACVTCGTAVPAGMFVPSLLSGAAFGRLVGHLLHRLDNTRGTFADSGTYALMGAAAITGGIARMTISLTVMILEATGDMQYVLPLMLTVMAARLVGNVFTEGLYDNHIHCRHLYFLEEDEGLSSHVELHDLTVCEIMTKRPICLRPVVRVGDVYDMLCAVRHHCFPIVDERDGNVLCGTVTRKVICTLMKHKAFGPASSDPNSSRRISPLVNWGTLECVYPKYPDVSQITITEQDRLSWIDLRPYIDCATYTINEHASVQRTYRMFRTLGLRHLCVINKYNQVLGIVTRADLVSAHMMKVNEGLGDRRQHGGRKKGGRKEYLQHTISLDLEDRHSADTRVVHADKGAEG